MKVSLIIPTHNRAVMLSELLDSVRRQTHRPIEVVIVDDGSTDKTSDVVKMHLAKGAEGGGFSLVYDRLKGGGAQVARNRGASLASGSALMFVDSDDALPPAGLGQLARALEMQSECSYVYGKVQTVDSTLKPFAESRIIGGKFADDAKGLFGYHWHTMGALYTRNCVDRVGRWNEDLTFSQDWEYQVRVKLSEGVGCFVDELVGFWRQHDGARIGVKGFSDAFLESVQPLFESIHSHAVRAGRSSRDFEALLAKRLIVHAVGCGAYNRTEAKARFLAMAAEIARSNVPLKALALFVSVLPVTGDRMLSKAHARFLGCHG